jgi:sulfate permease, SulP family
MDTAAASLQARLPDPSGPQAPVVVLRLGGHNTLGATFFVVAADYARRLEAVGGRLYLSGSNPVRIEQIARTGRVRCHGPSAGLRSDRLTGEPRSPLTTPPRHGWSDQTAAQ